MRRIFALLVTIILVSCNNQDSNTFKLEGNAFGFEDGTQVLLYGIDENNQSKLQDTLEVVQGKFSKTFPKSESVDLHFLKINGAPNNVLFFAENENLKANIYKDSITASTVSGGRQNDLFYEYTKATSKFAKRQMAIMEEYKVAQLEQDGIVMEELRGESTELNIQEKSYKRQFVKEHSNSVFGMMLLSEMFSKQEIEANEVTDLIAGLGPKMAVHKTTTDLKKMIEAKKKASIGGLAPAFSAPTPTGEMLSLQESLGEYTIIDFWASWCRPCRMENPNVVKVYNKYHDKGLNIISVSLDKAGQKERWIKAIEDDNMDWYHVSNLQFWQDPIARQYNVRSIPATFLLDKNGNIIDKNLRGQALENKIASLLD